MFFMLYNYLNDSSNVFAISNLDGSKVKVSEARQAKTYYRKNSILEYLVSDKSIPKSSFHFLK